MKTIASVDKTAEKHTTLFQHSLSLISVPILYSAKVSWDLQISLVAVQNQHMRMFS